MSGRQAGAAWATIGIGKVSGAALLFGFLLLAGRTGSFTIASWHAVGPGALHDMAWTLMVVGFGAKLGLVPMQVWIPVGYPAAPGPARAAMAGIAALVGVYGLWRFLGVLGRPPVWLMIAVLLAAGVTALVGITVAGVQSRLSRVIACSSIENAGRIVTAYGVALTGAVLGSRPLVAIGLLAATLQTVAYAIAKSTRSVSLAHVEAAVGTDDLDALRGIGRRLRWSGAAFGAGAVTLAGLPPTIGAAVSPWEVRYIARGLSPLVPRSATTQALKSPWVLQPVFHGFSILSPSWLWVAMPIAFCSVLGGALALSGGRYLRVRRVPAWHSATSGVEGPSSYTAFGFANPLRHVLANILGTRRTVDLVASATSDGHGGEAPSPSQATHVETRTSVVEPVETYIYRPIRVVAVGIARVAKRLQSGNLNAYVAYMFLALLAMLAVTAALR